MYLLRFPLSAAARAIFVGVVVTLVSLAGLVAEAAAETRSLKLYNNHTGERATIVFKRNGRFIQSGLRELNQFLRDWRRNEATKMDPHLFDLVWEVYQKSGSNDYIHVVSGYRSPATNNMLRGRSRGVAKKSQHMRGKAMDFFIPDANLAKLRAIGLRMQIGGVGYYPTSGSPFVHMDTGNVRHWPRMTRQQLARVFPNGKTIHIPTDGKPMPGYRQALADLKARGSGTRQVVLASNDDEDDDTPERSAGNTRGQSLTNVTANPSIRPTPVGANVGGGNTSGKSLIASLFGRGGPRPPAEVGTTSSPRPSRVGRQDDNGNTGRGDSTPVAVAIADVTPPAKPAEPQTLTAVADASADIGADDRAGTAPAERAAEPIVVAALPHSKPMIQRAAPVDAIGAIDSVVDPGRSTGTDKAPNPTLAAYASGSEPVPLLRPRPSVTAGNNQLSAAPRERPAGEGRAEARAKLARAAPGDGEAVAARVEAALVAARNKAGKPAPRAPVLSGRIPADADPFAHFASLPTSNDVRMISGDHSTRTGAFADLRHPDQRKLGVLFGRPTRLFNAGFQRQIYGALRTDRFDGPAVVALSLVATD
nr:DUF882 domain-containing protein [Breoghania corrubedonensis]